LWVFPGFWDTGLISGTAVMARRAGRRDRGKSGIPGEVADSGAGAAVARAVVGGAGGIRDTRAEGRREGKDDWGFKEIIELSGKVFKTHVI
jgi:hypothetical protein